MQSLFVLNIHSSIEVYMYTLSSTTIIPWWNSAKDPSDSLTKICGGGGGGFIIVTIEAGRFVVVLERLILCVGMLDPSEVDGGDRCGEFWAITIDAGWFLTVLERLALCDGMVGKDGVFGGRLVVISTWVEVWAYFHWWYSNGCWFFSKLCLYNLFFIVK